MLQSFADKDTERVWRRRSARKLDQGTQRIALRKLLILDAADAVGDLRVPPGNRLEKLRGDRAGSYSIRVNRQWRICFRWSVRDRSPRRCSSTSAAAITVITLSPRERQILAMVVLDFSNAEIARKLFVTESNVKNHLSSAFQKLGVKSRSAAAELILDHESGLGPGILRISPEEVLPEIG